MEEKVAVDVKKSVATLSETIEKKEPEVKVKIQKPVKAAAAHVNTRVEYHRLKDFRIEGGTVNRTLSYRNVCFQMEKGLELGYSEKVMNAVIETMKLAISGQSNDIAYQRSDIFHKTYCKRSK